MLHAAGGYQHLSVGWFGLFYLCLSPGCPSASVDGIKSNATSTHIMQFTAER